MEGFWPIFFLAVILKIPVAALLYLVWWAIKQTPETEEAPPEAEDRDSAALAPRAEEAARPSPRRAARTGRPAAPVLPAGWPHPDLHPACPGQGGDGPRPRLGGAS